MLEDKQTLFYELLELKSKEKDGKLKISLEELKNIYIEVFRSNYHQPVSDWSKLNPILKILEAKDKLRLPIGSKGYISYQKTLLPTHIFLTKKKQEKRERTWKNFKWHPKLLWVPTVKNLSLITEERLMKIHKFLQTQSSKILPISEKERALQIFGDEKELVRLSLSSIFKNNPKRDIFKITTCYPTFEPLIGFRFEDSHSSRVIFLENRDTFLSVSKICLILKNAPFQRVYYGQGLNFKTSVLSIPYEIDKNLQIEYFGDIDPTGFLIPIEAKKILQERHQGYDITFAVGLYESLIERHRKGGYQFSSKDGKKLKDSYLDFLTLEKRQYVLDLFEKKERIPQELLNLTELFHFYSNDSFPEKLYLSHHELLKELYRHHTS